MSGGSLKVANKKFTSIRNEYELQFSERSMITAVEDDVKSACGGRPQRCFHPLPLSPRPLGAATAAVKSISFSFVKISVLETLPPESNVDVLGVVTQTGAEMSITTKTGKPMIKKDVHIADESGIAVSLTLWDKAASQAISVGDIVAAKGARLGEFGGRSLSASFATILEVNPQNLPEAHALHAWYSGGGTSAGVRSISDQRSGAGGGALRDAPMTAAEQRKTLDDLKFETPDKESVVVKTIITFVKT